MLFSLLGWPFCPLHGSFNTHGHSHCVSGRCLWKLPSHLHHVQPFHHQGQRSPQLLKDKVWIHLHKQSKSIALTVGAQLMLSTAGPPPKSFHRWAWISIPAGFSLLHQLGMGLLDPSSKQDAPTSHLLVSGGVGAVKVLWVTPSSLLLSLLICQLILLEKVEIQGCFLGLRLIGLGISLTGLCFA